MKKLHIISLVAGSLLSGCAAGHSIKAEPDSLIFTLHMPEAKQVRLAVSADRYMLHDAQLNRAGSWQVKVPGTKEIKYFYVVDGTTYLPECTMKETDDFGSENCIYQP